MKTLLLSAVAGIALAVLPYHPAQATNGYFQNGYGSTSKGMVGAGVAFSQDALAGATNPAGMLGVGNRVDIGLSLFIPTRRVIGGIAPPVIPVGDTGGNQEPFFIIPDIGANWMINKKSSIGINFFGNGGMNTDFNSAIFAAFNSPGNVATSPTGVDLAQAFIGITYARELAPGHTVGIMPIAAIQKFKAFGLETFRGISIHPNHVTGNGFDHSFGGGVRVGYQGKITNSLTVGASYQTRMWMSELSKYRGLFAEEGDFDIPPTVTLGFAYKVTPAVTFVFDYQRIFYNEIKAIANSAGLNLQTLPAEKRLGSNDGIGFGWEDMDIFKFGLQWDVNNKLSLRTGFSHNTKTFENSQVVFNILAPGIVQNHFSLGGTYRPAPSHEFNVVYTRAFNTSITGTDPNLQGQNITLNMHQNDFLASYTFKW